MLELSVKFEAIIVPLSLAPLSLVAVIVKVVFEAKTGFEKVIVALAKLEKIANDKIAKTNKLNDLFIFCNHCAVVMVYKFFYYIKYRLN